ncbi:response regulator transcription factor [Xylella taiwanensis]|uniref:LytTR family DNA-binding domain-containing protein n=1 Tax=Xylella taiwanensis TaxID=1444770 RepID=Z9JHK6_9GAMM|nr:LytTR family DNA-binding domain-containing protein [Xylella taiwanensis]AXI83418.1 chemotaxis protein CheY [Xylella taiwanensis]EWS77478.1 transcriptional regulator [Xylella taiwanensis]MCD8456488.1 LytTR family DNA-binding domain-containing protein [Xylella taiwanensis]MCD8458895.1 LytTR family DNA-binding domain-containing protein [Xylella taiwanensis]MCD8461032.1 LytTR family DNA-binding domain-containing protein [Xylella taiwanensis]
MLRILIADDEPFARERLRVLLQAQVQHLEVVAEAENGGQVLQNCERLHPDLVLLDIAMPGIDGLETVRYLRHFNDCPAVVFCTAYGDHALSAFDVEAIDYLMKPVRAERLNAALERVRTFVAGRLRAPQISFDGRPRTHLCARIRGALRLIPLDEVRYLQAEEKYVVICHAHGEDLIEESLKSLEKEFSDRLVRIHRNCLIARAELTELRRCGDGQVQAVLRNVVTPLAVSRRCVPLLCDQLRLSGVLTGRW